MQRGKVPTDRIVSLDEARAILAVHLVPRATRDAPLAECSGLFASRGVCADRALPRDTTSRRDGYAIRSSDTAVATAEHPVRLRVRLRTATAGAPNDAAPTDDPLKEGQAMRIMTGALLPEGADAILAFEELEKPENSQITVSRSVESGRHVRPAGSEIHVGELVVNEGEQIGPGVCGLAAALGYPGLPVYVRPRALVIAIGDEILEPGATPTAGRLYNDGATMLAELLKEPGIDATIATPVPDDRAAIVRALERAFAEQYDLILTTGGTGGGDHDFIRGALRDAAGELLFSGLTLRPGSGTTCAMLRNAVCFALPGTPGAATTVFELLVRPAARVLCGSGSPGNPKVTAVLTEPLRYAADQLVRPYRVQLSISRARVWARPVARTHLYREIWESNGIWLSRPGCPAPRAGDSLEVEVTGSIHEEDQ